MFDVYMIEGDHLPCQPGSYLESQRNNNLVLQVSGAFLGTNEYVRKSVDREVRSLDVTVKTLLQFVHVQV